MRLAVTCNPHLWQNDLDLLRATAVTWGGGGGGGGGGGDGYQNKSQHRKMTLEKKILPRAPARTRRTRDLNFADESVALPLSYIPSSQKTHTDAKSATITAGTTLSRVHAAQFN